MSLAPPSPLPPIAVFDLDGTLVDTLPDLIEVLNETFAGLGLPPLPEAEGRRFIGAGIRPLIERALIAEGQTLPAAAIDRLYEDYVAAYAARIARRSRPYPGLIPALDALARRGVVFAVCTNKLEWLSRRLLTELGLIGRFRAVGGGDSFAVRKPEAGHLMATIAAAGGDPARAVMVGDSMTDVATARNAGVPAIAVSFGYSDVPPADLGADHLIDHFDALPAIISNMLRLP